MVDLDDLALIGIAQTAQESMVLGILRRESTVAEIREACERSAYWPRFVQLVRVHAVPTEWLPGPLGSAIRGWAAKTAERSVRHEVAPQSVPSA